MVELTRYPLLAKGITALSAGLVSACDGSEGAGPRSVEPPGFAARAPSPASASQAFAIRGLQAPDDPTQAGLRLMPETLGECRSWGTEPAGGQRAIVTGVRVGSSPLHGALVPSPTPIPPHPPTSTPPPLRP